MSNKDPMDFSAISRTSSKRLPSELEDELDPELEVELESKRSSIAFLAPLIISSKKSPPDEELVDLLEDEPDELESPNNESKRSSKSEPPVELEDLVEAVVVELLSSPPKTESKISSRSDPPVELEDLVEAVVVELLSSPPKTESTTSSRSEPPVEVDDDFGVVEVLLEVFESAYSPSPNTLSKRLSKYEPVVVDSPVLIEDELLVLTAAVFVTDDDSFDSESLPPAIKSI